ncbi:MAG: WcaI family glycosyltransferase [Chitinophagaceae bacterium]
MTNTKPSILIVGINFFPEPTGVGKYTSEMAFYLGQNDHQVKVVTGFPYYPAWKVFPGYKNLFYKTEKINNVSVTRCPLYVPASLSGLKRMMQDFSFFSTSLVYVMGLMLRGRRYDVVFVASPSFMSGFVGSFYRFIYRKTKFVYHIQDLQVDAAEELGMIKSSLLLKILKRSEGFILKKASWVSTISLGMQKKIKDKPFPIKREYLFPNWVDFSNIFAKPVDAEKIRPLGFPLDKEMVFYSGAVGEKQGLEMVLAIAKKALSALPGLVYVISGSGPYVGVLQKHAADQNLSNLFFIDLQPLDIFNELLNHAFIHLVIQKGKASDLLLPSKLTNILAVGGLCIVTAAAGTSLCDIVDGNQLGVVIPPEDPRAFWNALNDCCTYHDRAQVLKANARSFAEKNLRKENVINAFISELNDNYI